MQCMALTSLMISCVRIGATLEMCRLQLGQSHTNRSWDCNICVPRMENRIGSFSRSRRSNSNRIHLICGHCFNGQHHRLTSPFNSNLSQPFVCSIFIIIIAHAFTSRLFAVAHSSYPSLSTMYVLSLNFMLLMGHLRIPRTHRTVVPNKLLSIFSLFVCV